MDITKLSAPFKPEEIEWRVGSTTQDKKKGMALAYIDARLVMERLDAVCGPDGWQCRYLAIGEKKTCCEIGVRVGEQWIWKADGSGDTDVEGEKGAFSDSFKRAAVKWGIGRYLYDVSSPWVELEPAGRSFKIKDSEFGKLRAALSKGGVAQPVEQRSPKPQAAGSSPATPATGPELMIRVPSVDNKPDWAAWLKAIGHAIDETSSLTELNALERDNAAPAKNLSFVSEANATKLAKRFEDKRKYFLASAA
jgi:hypothetical protein